MAVDTQTVDALLLVLNQEFDALKVQDLAQFEALQADKATLLARLEGVSPDEITEDVRDTLIQCRDAHRRNETLIQHQLMAIRGTLQSLTATHATETVDVYDRLGHVRSGTLGRGYNDA
jgi:flagellar biosynthesis/type III secretory pathway chaperone